MSGLIPLLLLPVLMWLLLIRPQQKRMKAQQALLSALGEGDEVMTTAGIYGYINAIEGEMVWLEIAPEIEIRIARSAIAKKVEPTGEAANEVGEPAADTDEA